MKHRKIYRGVFLAAGIYNLGWGLFAVLFPHWLFDFAGMPRLNYPEIYACLGMVVGLYGFIYLEIARVPERGFLLAAVGLVGKILGPIGLALLIIQGKWRPAAIVLCLTNDFIWWLPFALYLRAAWEYYRADLCSPTLNAQR